MLGFYREDFEEFEIECEKTSQELKDTKSPLTHDEVLKYLQLMAVRQSIFASFMNSH